jgi:hydrogenase nickel incorporation protein HypB
MHGRIVRIATDALDANDTIAGANRADFDEHGTAVVNFMSAPGAGKTSLLERALEVLQHELSIGVLEGDVQGRFDADRISRFHVAVTQLDTDPGFGGECHLDANMVRSALSEIPLDGLELLVIENVGNLVCPGEFKIREHARVLVASVTEGEDEPLKHPLMFRACDLVLVNKVDLLTHLDYDLEEFLANLDEVHPDVPYILTSARTGMGIEAWCEWLRARAGAKRVRERARAHA